MLTEIYIEALLVDEELVGRVWEAWDAREIDDQIALSELWLQILRRSKRTNIVEVRDLPTIF